MTNITAYQGLPLNEFIPLSNNDGTAYDYTLYTYEAEVRSYVNDALIATLTVTGGSSSDDSGVYVTASAVTTAAISPGIYKFDVLQTTTSDSSVIPAFSGDFVLLDTRTAP